MKREWEDYFIDTILKNKHVVYNGFEEAYAYQSLPFTEFGFNNIIYNNDGE
jgi:hypothetical protein